MKKLSWDFIELVTQCFIAHAKQQKVIPTHSRAQSKKISPQNNASNK
jgi:hypothetical protein